MRRSAALSFSLGLMALPAFAAEQPTARGGGHPAVVKPPAVKAPAPQRAGGGQGRAAGRAGAAAPGTQPNPLDKLLKMSPEDRQKFLDRLPQQQRENLQRRINEVEKMPPALRNRLITRAEMMNSLAPQKRQQVRRAMQQFQDLPDERRTVIGREIQTMAPMPDEQRREHMNAEEFRNRYSVNEQQMMGNLMEITPPPQF